MIFISDLRGQLGNRIFVKGYAMALAEYAGQTLVDFSVDNYARYFPATRRKWWLEWPYKIARYAFRAFVKTLWYIPVLSDLLIIDVTFANSAETSSANPAFLERIKRRPLTFIRMKSFFDLSQITFPPTETIRKHFTPDPEILAFAHEFCRKAKGDADILMAIHIRRGDYITHLGGRHFYPIEFYRDCMGDVAKLFPGKRLAYLVCSNEAQPREFFAPYQITFGPGTMIEDLFCMAECDYLLGPPSTFSLWAAYYGRKPVCQMFRHEAPTSLDQFVMLNGNFSSYDVKTV